MTKEDTRQRIARSALRLLFERGIRDVTSQAAASASGLTRMTVHRYYPVKKELVRAAIGVIAQVFEEAMSTPSSGGFDATMARLGEAIASLPPGDLPTRLAEVRNVYPEVYEEFLSIRSRGLDAVLERLFCEARSQGQLRSDLDQRVVKVFVREATINILSSPALLAQDLAPEELFTTVKEILLHGLVEYTTPSSYNNAVSQSDRGT